MKINLNRRIILGTCLATLALVLAPAAIAAPGAWSSEPVRIVVTFPPGGTSDLVARLLAQHLDADYGQKAVVDNRPGAAGTVAADYVSRQAPDGTTLILSNNAPFTISPTRFKSIPYKPLAGFSHIAYIGASAPGLFVKPATGINTLKEYVKYVKNSPMTYGSSGVGSISHILGEAVDAAVGVKSIHVPYKGSSPAIQDFRAGVLDSFYDMVVQNSDMIEDKEAVAIAIASPERNPEVPNVPTFRELGHDLVYFMQRGVIAPSGIGKDVQAYYVDVFSKVYKSSEWQDYLAKNGMIAGWLTGAKLTGYFVRQREAHRKLLKSLGELQ